jgi:hypothetical protein
VTSINIKAAMATSKRDGLPASPMRPSDGSDSHMSGKLSHRVNPQRMSTQNLYSNPLTQRNSKTRQTTQLD